MQKSFNAESNTASSLHNFKMESHLKNGKVYDNARNCLLQQAQNMISIQLNKVSV
jgi:hypothetical protein